MQPGHPKSDLGCASFEAASRCRIKCQLTLPLWKLYSGIDVGRAHLEVPARLRLPGCPTVDRDVTAKRLYAQPFHLEAFQIPAAGSDNMHRWYIVPTEEPIQAEPIGICLTC